MCDDRLCATHLWFAQSWNHFQQLPLVFFLLWWFSPVSILDRWRILPWSSSIVGNYSNDRGSKLYSIGRLTLCTIRFLFSIFFLLFWLSQLKCDQKQALTMSASKTAFGLTLFIELVGKIHSSLLQMFWLPTCCDHHYWHPNKKSSQCFLPRIGRCFVFAFNLHVVLTGQTV